MTTTTATETISERLSRRNNDWKTFYAEKIDEIKRDKGHWVDQGLSTVASVLRTIGHATLLSATGCVLVFALVFITYDGTNITLEQAQYFAKLTLMVSFVAALGGCISTNSGRFKSLKNELARHYANEMSEKKAQIELIDERIEKVYQESKFV